MQIFRSYRYEHTVDLRFVSQLPQWASQILVISREQRSIVRTVSQLQFWVGQLSVLSGERRSTSTDRQLTNVLSVDLWSISQIHRWASQLSVLILERWFTSTDRQSTYSPSVNLISDTNNFYVRVFLVSSLFVWPLSYIVQTLNHEVSVNLSLET